MTETKKWTDRERVLLLCSRGSLARTRHLINDLKRLMPHVRSEAKFDKKSKLEDLNEMCELANCTKCLYFESRKGRDTYLWVSNVDGGPSLKFLMRNIHTMNELNLVGNCLKGSRPILSFDAAFDQAPHFKLIKELLVNTFKTPSFHPRSQPFIDHVFNFALTADNNIWFRNYQIVNEGSELQEIGPRFVLELIKVFDGSFNGAVLYENPEYVTPNLIRRRLKLEKASKQHNRLEQKECTKVKDDFVRAVKFEDPIGNVFDTDNKDAPMEEVKVEDHVAAKLDKIILKKGKQSKKKKRKAATGNNVDTKRSKPDH